MINAYYDFDEMGQGFVPYISGGIGLSRMVPLESKTPVVQLMLGREVKPRTILAGR